jgi:hypothetical protein
MVMLAKAIPHAITLSTKNTLNPANCHVWNQSRSEYEMTRRKNVSDMRIKYLSFRIRNRLAKTTQ